MTHHLCVWEIRLNGFYMLCDSFEGNTVSWNVCCCTSGRWFTAFDFQTVLQGSLRRWYGGDFLLLFDTDWTSSSISFLQIDLQKANIVSGKGKCPAETTWHKNRTLQCCWHCRVEPDAKQMQSDSPFCQTIAWSCSNLFKWREVVTAFGIPCTLIL
jgi:hypothetical protein